MTEKSMIRRSSYTRKSYVRKDGVKVKGTKVKSSLIIDRGQKGKGKKLFEVKDSGFLTEKGYSLKKPETERRVSLRKASKEKGSLKVLKHLNAIRTLQKSNPENYSKLDKDVKFIQKEYRKEKKIK
jgi:hypothetical protein